jgi:hypothetical protein
MSRCNQGYSNVLSMDITLSESFTRHELSALLGTPLVAHMENALAGGSQRALVTSKYVESAVFYTDGSLIEGSTGFALHRTGVGGFGFKLSSPAGVFPTEPSALFMALRHIREVIQPPEKCLILTDSLSLIKAMLSRRISWRTHPLVYECKQLCFDLTRDLIKVRLTWILAGRW